MARKVSRDLRITRRFRADGLIFLGSFLVGVGSKKCLIRNAINLGVENLLGSGEERL
jgi:hypothetical protein